MDTQTSSGCSWQHVLFLIVVAIRGPARPGEKCNLTNHVRPWSDACGGGGGYGEGMDLTYPPEAEEFRAEIRGWLEENLPDGVGRRRLLDDAGGAQGLQRGVDREAPRGGWICASWPTEYGGKGLSPARAGGAQRGVRPGRGAAARRLLRRHPGRPDHPAVGHRGAEAGVHPRDPRRAPSPGARGSPSPTPAATWPRSRPGPSSTATSG